MIRSCGIGAESLVRFTLSGRRRWGPTMFLSVLLVLFSLTIDRTECRFSNVKCDLSDGFKEEVRSHRPVAKKIMNHLLEGKSKGFVYEEVQKFVDTFGNRMSGTENLENAIDYMLKKLKNFELDNVHGEIVTIPHWVRGNESATLLSPRRQKLAMLGLGYSIGTPPNGIVAEVVVVTSFDELEQVGSYVKGKIVVFNEQYVSYPQTVKYRDYAATRAAKHGAVASLVSSVTPFSMHTPHTGMQDYEEGVARIPVAAIAVEDAHMLARMQQAGANVTVRLEMEAKLLPDIESRNVVADLTGTDKPEKLVVVSGHIDSWDVGQGAMDDAGGAFIAWGALALLKRLNLRPKRTLRSILWTGEEVGLIGASAYLKRHQKENDNLVLLMESDEGTFAPLGLKFQGADNAACILHEVLKLLKPINATRLERARGVGSDITVWDGTDVPMASLLNDNDRYFWYHHTEADTLDILDSDDLDRCTAVWATIAYVVGNLSIDLPRV